MSMKVDRLCNKCNEKVEIETDIYLKKEYKYVCHNCDENLYEFEVYDEYES